MKVAFQGEHGAYGELAAFEYFGNKTESMPCKSFAEVFDKVMKGNADFGIIPIENSLEGSVGQNYDLLMKHNLTVCGEMVLRVEHCLIVNPGTKTKDLKKVYSHSQALGQCRKFIEDNKLDGIPGYDTAGSVKLIKERGEKDAAAIASELAAKIYGMEILKKGIETDRKNFTRFLIISKSIIQNRREKTSIILALKHKPGSLFSALKGFSENGINITKLESRPIAGRPWEYLFYLDFEGDSEDPKIKRILAGNKRNFSYLKIIGSYPKAGASFQVLNESESKRVGWPTGKKIAIIGAAGGMGRWFCRFFTSEGIEVIASGRTRSKLDKLQKEIKVEIARDNIDAVRRADIILVSVMPKDFEKVVKEIAPFIKNDQVLLDITSSKERPVAIMHRYVKNAVVLGAHPLFGPGAEDTNQNVILTPTNRREKALADTVSKWFGEKGFIVQMTSPKKHDQMMAIAQGLSHFIGLVTGETWMSFNFEELKGASPTSFKRLLGLVESVANSDPEFYANLQVILPHVTNVESKFIANAQRVAKLVKAGDEAGFAAEIRRLSKRVHSAGRGR
jgi:prephenate dehydratase/prephenate dehydrogenase